MITGKESKDILIQRPASWRSPQRNSMKLPGLFKMK